jgi:hypothetical protein
MSGWADNTWCALAVATRLSLESYVLYILVMIETSNAPLHQIYYMALGRGGRLSFIP